MNRHLGFPAIFAAAGLGLAGLLVYPRTSPPPRPPLAPPGPPAPAPPPPSAFSWRLTGAMSAHRALVMEVETTRPGEAVAIAQQLTEPYKDRFDEVLVFFHEPDSSPRRPFERVQWTRGHGYRTLSLRD